MDDVGMRAARHARRPWALGMLASLVVVLCGCGEGAPASSDQQPMPALASQTGSDAASPTPADSRPTGSNSTAPAQGRPPRITVKRVASYSFAAPDVGWVTMAGSGIAFATTVNGLTPTEVDTVRIMKPGDREPTVVFTGTMGGMIEGVAAGRNYLVWTYDEVQQQDPTDDVPWVLYANDLHTGRTRVVARSRTGSPLTPWSSMSGDRIAWVDYHGDVNMADLYVSDLHAHETRKVGTNLPTDQIAFNGDTIVFTGAVAEAKSPTDLGKNDLFALDPRTGKSRRLTYDGRDDLPTVAGSWLAWQIRKPGRDAIHKLGALNLASGKRTTLDVDPEGYLTAGPGFAAYMGQSDGVSVIPLADRARPIQVPDSSDADLCVPCGISVSGSRMTWGIDRGHGRFRVNVGDVRLEPPPAADESEG